MKFVQQNKLYYEEILIKDTIFYPFLQNIYFVFIVLTSVVPL